MWPCEVVRIGYVVCCADCFGGCLLEREAQSKAMCILKMQKRLISSNKAGKNRIDFTVCVGKLRGLQLSVFPCLT